MPTTKLDMGTVTKVAGLLKLSEHHVSMVIGHYLDLVPAAVVVESAKKGSRRGQRRGNL